MAPERHHVNVLIVDDSSVMRTLVRRGLRHAGFTGLRHREASNGRGALEVLRKGDIDLTLTGWHMPEMSGIELIEAAKAEGIDTEIGLITSRSTRLARTTAAAAGARFLVPKPFTADALHEALDELIG